MMASRSGLTVKAHIDCHVEVERYRYSMPHSLAGQVLEARVTTAVVEIMHRGQRVASHARNSRQDGFTITAAHMPAAHRVHMEWTPQHLIHWGRSIGPAAAEAVTRLRAENRHPEHGYRACLGLLSLAEGVENANQVKFLAKYGCALAQGYYFSEPVTPGEITDIHRTKKSWKI